MTLLLSLDDLHARRAALAQAPDLAAVAARLAADLEPLLTRPIHVPREKALLSRWGGVCRDCQAVLGFDPWSPEAQQCPGCGRAWDTPQTRRWWVYWYQQWLAERVLHAALLASLTDDRRAGPRAAEILAALMEHYAGWPNADNVLGPSRPFFSTYLESVWVLPLAAATSLLEASGDVPGGLAADLRARLFRPSSALIADFDEGRSNRQVWNAAALYALGGVLGEETMRHAAAHGPSGIIASLMGGVLADGAWYEGENYHWFALRGLHWGAELLRSAGEVDLWSAAGPGERFRAAFHAPLLSVLPDFTFPARRDSKFGVTLRQRRMAELWESALAHAGASSDGPGAPFYASLLAHVYDPTGPEPGETSREITDIERPEAPGGVRRGALGWKALAWMPPALPPADPDAWRPGTAHLEATGLAVFRRDGGRTYVSLDYGESGGGHGHPDRLNLTLVADGVPWLLDFGTGSYVSPSLAWYRTTLAHNAPYLDGSSQAPARGWCVGYDEQDTVGWVCAQLPENGAFGGAALQRTVVVTPEYVLDIVQMGSTDGERALALPWHLLGDLHADEHGLTVTRADGAVLRVLLTARQPFQLHFSEGPGPAAAEGAPALRFAVVIASGEEVTLAACVALSTDVEEFECVDDGFVVRLAGGRVHLHGATETGWRFARDHGDPVDLGGVRDLPADAEIAAAGGMSAPASRGMFSPLVAAPETDALPAAAHCPAVAEVPALDGSLAGFDLSAPLLLDRADQYRRAEEPWPGADAFAARAWLNHDDDQLYVAVEVVAPDPWFRESDAPDPELDNENPDIQFDSVQVYVSTSLFYGWVASPDPHDPASVRIATVRGSDAETDLVTAGAWQATPDGYRLTLALSVADALEGFGFDVLVNRGRAGRERRVGQLVWSGARGERLYLAGDRPMQGDLPWVAVD